MAFDAAMLRFVVDELNRTLTGGKVDKIYQPGKEEAVFVIRCGGEEHRLDISAGGTDLNYHQYFYFFSYCVRLEVVYH